MDIKIAQQETITELVLENQKLKQERDEWRKSAFEITEQATKSRKELERESDEARIDAAQLADRLSGLELRTTEELARLEQSRDEWAAMCGRYKQERDEARKERDQLKQLLAADSENVDAYLGVCIDRDEAWEKLGEEMKWHHRTHTELVQTQCKILDMQMGRDEVQQKYDNLATEHMLVINKLCKERDEAREQLNHYRDKLDLSPISWDI